MPRMKHPTIKSITLGEVEYKASRGAINIPDEHVAEAVAWGFAEVGEKDAAGAQAAEGEGAEVAGEAAQQ